MKTYVTSATARQGRPGNGERGAAAVEFALVMPILFMVMFGILQYGLWFNDSLNARQGVREAARQGVVRNFDGGIPACGSGTDMAKLKCSTKTQISALTGTTYVKVKRPAAWARAEPLIVCTMVKSDGAIGLLPMPNGGWISSTTQMSIEQDEEPLPTGSTTADPLPSGVSYPC